MCYLCKYGPECQPKLCAWALAEIDDHQRRMYILSLLDEALGYITWNAQLIKKIEDVLEQEHRSIKNDSVHHKV